MDRHGFLIPNVDWTQDLSVWEWQIIDSQAWEKKIGSACRKDTLK